MALKSHRFFLVLSLIIGLSLANDIIKRTPEEELYELTRIEVDAKNNGIVLDLSARDIQRRSCPNNCSGSGNGYCAGSVCQCYSGYYGADCSVHTNSLSSGYTLYNQNVSYFNWRYYSLSQSGGTHNILFETMQTGTTGDCDQYVQYNTLPTRSSYRYRDITTNRNSTITVSNAASGTWFIGVYGFSSCNFTIRGTIVSTCPNQCSYHGNCLGGVCRCNAGWVGSDCSSPVYPLASGAQVSNSVAYRSFVYYSHQVASSTGNTLTYTMTSSRDCDLYINVNNAPSISSYLYANATSSSTTVIVITNPQVGTWYAGVYGFVSCTYTLSLSSTNTCPSDCSGRGTCYNYQCTCNYGYTGDYCQTRTAPLRNRESDGGYVITNTWNYYSYNAYTTENFVVQIVQQPGSAGDCDLFVKAGAIPTRFVYDYQDSSYLSNFSLSINDPAAATWYIGVYGFSTCTYNITTYETSSCGTLCSQHGYCNYSVCICQPGWTGESCEFGTDFLSPGGERIGIATNNSWIFYTYNMTGNSLYVVVNETSTVGKVWVYINDNSYPTLSEYMLSDTETNTNYHVIMMEHQMPMNMTVQIGVYANPYLINGNAPFTIVAWSPDF